MSEVLRQIIEAFQAWARNLTEALRDNRITINQWYEGMERIITRAHIAAMIEGLGTADIPANLLRQIRNNVDFQLDYLDNFKNVIETTPEFVNGWINRSTLYGGSAKVSYWEGKVVDMVGRALPLPAMPAQGTIPGCGGACLCEWDIKELDKEAGNYDAFWRRHSSDSCDICKERESQWQPVQIRGMVLQI